jgi:hypothetical protein
MADEKITALTAATVLADTDLLPIVQDMATLPVTKKTAWSLIKSTLAAVFMAIVSPGTSGNVLTSTGSAWESAAPTGGGGGAVTNALLNGGFPFSQYGGIASAVAMTDDVYNGPDRWYSLIQGANATVQQVTGGYNSKYACKLVAGGTTNRFGIAQILESEASIAKRGKTEIFQAWVKPVKNAGSGTMKIRVAILEWTGTADAVTSELVADWTSGTFTTAGFFASTTKTLVGSASFTATHNTWMQVSVSGAISTSCNNLIVFIWTEDAPAHASDYVLISEAGLYDASTVQAWNPRDVWDELDIITNYSERINNLNNNTRGISRSDSATSAVVALSYRRKRGTPNVVFSDPGDFYIGESSAAHYASAITLGAVDQNFAYVTITTTGLTDGRAGHLQCANSTGYILITSEL